MQKIAITLDPADLQVIERIVLDRNEKMALEFVQNTIKPRVDTALDKGHCRPVFEWRRGRPEMVEPPPIKET